MYTTLSTFCLIDQAHRLLGVLYNTANNTFNTSMNGLNLFFCFVCNKTTMRGKKKKKKQVSDTHFVSMKSRVQVQICTGLNCVQHHYSKTMCANRSATSTKKTHNAGLWDLLYQKPAPRQKHTGRRSSTASTLWQNSAATLILRDCTFNKRTSRHLSGKQCVGDSLLAVAMSVRERNGATTHAQGG